MTIPAFLAALSGGDLPADAVREERCLREPIGCGLPLVAEDGTARVLWDADEAARYQAEWQITGLCPDCQDRVEAGDAMTASDDLARALYLAGGALPMPLGSDRCYRPAPKPGDADAPLPQLQADLRELAARQSSQEWAAALAERLRWLMAHPDEAPHTPATAGELAEYRHLLYDADPDATVPAFPYPTTALEA